MVDPVTMSAIMGAVPQLFKVVDGFVQKKKGNDILDNNVRPVYQTPAEIDQALSIAKREASRIGVAGQDMIEANMGASLGSAAQEVKDVSSSSAEALAAITSLYGNQQVQQRNLGIQGSQDRDNRLALLKENLNLKAQYVDKEFQVNEMQPFIDNAMAGGALVQSGLTNVYSGLEGLGRVGSQSVLANAMLGNTGELDPNTKISVTNPESSTTDPESSTTDSESSTTDPESSTTDPESSTTDVKTKSPTLDQNTVQTTQGEQPLSQEQLLQILMLVFGGFK